MTRLIASLLALACLSACGRLGYEDQTAAIDPTNPDAASSDGAPPDASPSDAASGSDAAGCPVGEPFDMTILDSTDLNTAVAMFPPSCGTGTWCALDEAMGFTYTPCAGAEPTLEELVTAAIYGQLVESRGEFQYGQVVDPTALAETQPLNYTDGQALLETLQDMAGTSLTESWHYVSEVPCHNCTAWETMHVLVYRDVRTVFVLPGGYGWDS